MFFRCGDILLAVNGRSTSGMIHACLAKMLKELKGKITLTIVSWPGTFFIESMMGHRKTENYR